MKNYSKGEMEEYIFNVTGGMEISEGDILLVRSNNILAKTIQFGMKLKYYFALDFKKRDIQNHAAIGVGNNRIVEAVYKTVKNWNINDAYRGKKNATLSVYSFDWNPEALAKLKAISKPLEGKKYQYSNFAAWAVNIFTLGAVWPGKRYDKAKERQYCTETVGTCIYYMTEDCLDVLSIVTKRTFRKFWRTSPNKLADFCRDYGKLKSTYEF